MKLNLNDLTEALISGGTFFGTGGGGLPQEARTIYRDLIAQKNTLVLASIDEFSDDAVFVSGFAVGSVSSSIQNAEPLSAAFDALRREIDRPIAGIIPVEIGPKAIALAFGLAAVAGVPVLDADVVGGRSTPEVFLETITLFQIPRTPAVVIGAAGDMAILLKSSSPEREERFFREFAADNGGQAYVVGYVLTAANVRRAVECGTVSAALEAGRYINSNKTAEYLDQIGARVLFEGRIARIEQREQRGFFTRMISIEDGKRQARMFIKNENLILWIDEVVALTCPDSLILLDQAGQPIYNADLAEGASVRVIGLPARPLWQSEAGQLLFSPRTFGFDFDGRAL